MTLYDKLRRLHSVLFCKSCEYARAVFNCTCYLKLLVADCEAENSIKIKANILNYWINCMCKCRCVYIHKYD